MVLCSCGQIRFKAFSFDEVSKNPENIRAKQIRRLPGKRLEIEKINGFRILLRRGEYATIWPDGDIATASKEAVEKCRIK